MQAMHMCRISKKVKECFPLLKQYIETGGDSSGGNPYHNTGGGGSQYGGAATMLVTPALLLFAFLLTVFQ